jgi:hypothetical protein
MQFAFTLTRAEHACAFDDLHPLKRRLSVG